jgi:hypothetical protein
VKVVDGDAVTEVEMDAHCDANIVAKGMTGCMVRLARRGSFPDPPVELEALDP